ncbi:MAG: hypothetical protein C4327_07010 [Meiothermus sp.]
MRKTGLIALALGLALTLSGCLIVLVPPEVYDLTYRSSWLRTSDKKPVICDNKDTTVEYSFKYTNLQNISSWTETWTGSASSQFNFTENRYPNSPDTGVTVDTASKTITVTRKFSRGTSPYSVTPQSITITPINPPTSQTGEARLVLQFNLTDGNTISLPRIILPVYSGCQI